MFFIPLSSDEGDLGVAPKPDIKILDKYEQIMYYFTYTTHVYHKAGKLVGINFGRLVSTSVEKARKF